MKGKAGAAKKAGPAPPGALKAGNPLMAAKKAGPAAKKAGLVPRDFVTAKIAINELIGDYSGVYPLMPTPQPPTLRQLILNSVRTHDFSSLQSLSKSHGSKFTTEIHQTSCQFPVLIVAAEVSNFPALQFFLSAGVHPDQTSTAGETAVHSAVRAEFEQGLILLNSYHASMWLADLAGNSPFVIAAVKGAEAILMRLVDFGVNPWKRDGTGRFEIEYIADGEVRKRVGVRAYWLKKRGFTWVAERSQFAKVGFNLKELISTYL